MSIARELVAAKPCVIFDLYHTLTGLESGLSERPWTADLLGISRTVWTEQLLDKSRERLIGKERDPYRIVEKMAHAVDPSIPDGLIRRAMENRVQFTCEALTGIPTGNVAVIRELKSRGKRIALLSNADVIETTGWNESPLAPYFDVVVFSCDAGFAKPDPEIYQYCLDKLGVQASDGVFVGDGGSNELAGAKNIGLSTVMITGVIKKIWPERIDARRKDSDAVIEVLEELL